ncbi:formimidoylglutamase [Chitinophaga sp. Cy-1792]|uniref:formimidoylglutamase n=1 Tax=Chitinophaga sp. Cy-1792 TaxID=2608339 RepID=UPI00141E919C|nr:formimidoylglutamase [Chitinophaga sp. Cy-1792]NIG53629.1 formimidoylglutamase [Chitinophaga sp. Cy-1792]
MITKEFYHPTTEGSWTGRTDGTTPDLLRWHQVVKPVNLLSEPLPPLAENQKGVAFLGFACDEGVRRNKGRVGAKDGPAAIRAMLGNFPAHLTENAVLIDAGDVACLDGRMENAQVVLAEAVKALLLAGYLPVVLGGGHEIAYGHARGIREYAHQQKVRVGYINIDAHFDIRVPGPEGPSSGTSFYQLAQEAKDNNEPFNYLALGIQKLGNTRQLFNLAGESGATYVSADAFHLNDKDTLNAAVEHFLTQVDYVYLTTCLDVFSSAFAPGVSATAYNGIQPDGLFLQSYRAIMESGKVKGVDVAELNPVYDLDNRTAKLAAALVFETVMAHCGDDTI